MTTLRSFCVTNKWTKQPPKTPQPFESHKYHRRCSSITHTPVRFEAEQMAFKVEDYTSVYKNDFQAWKVKKRLPYKLADSLTVTQGLVATDRPSQGRFQKVKVASDSKAVPQVRNPQPFESVTSYRSDYITHPVQRTRRVKPAHPTKGLLSEPAVCLKPRAAWEVNQDICDEASTFLQEFKTWSLENKFKGKARESGPPAGDTEHKCQWAKPGLPSEQSRDTTRERFGGTTTMKEDYRSWDMPRRFPSVRREQLDRPKKSTPQTFRRQPKSDERASSCNATKTTHRPAENGALSNLESSGPATEDSRMYWTRSLDRGVSWADGGICDESPQAHKIISCLVSSRS